MSLKQHIITQLLKDEQAWSKLYEQLQDALTRTQKKLMHEGITATLDHMRTLDAGTFTEKDATLILNTLQTYMGAEAMMVALQGPVINLSNAIYQLGRKEVIEGVDISFRHPDYNALELTKRTNLYWVGNSWNSHTNKLIQDALLDYFKKGYSRQQFMERFAKDFAGLSERGQHYWELLADHTATRTREIGRIDAYQSGDIQYVQVRAHIDSRTTMICKMMHRKIIPVSHLIKQRDDYLDAASKRDMETAKSAWRMWRNDDDLSQISPDAKKLPPNTGMPPYHFRCRTITVAYFTDETLPVADDEILPASSPQTRKPTTEIKRPNKKESQNYNEWSKKVDQELAKFSPSKLKAFFNAQVKNLTNDLKETQQKLNKLRTDFYANSANFKNDPKALKRFNSQQTRYQNQLVEKLNTAKLELNPIATHICKRLYPHIEWDFVNIDPRCLVPILKELDKLAKDFPKIFNKLKYIGAGHSKTEHGQFVFQTFQREDMQNAYGFAQGKFGIIALSERMYDNSDKLNESLKESFREKWLTSKRPQDVINHEFGHHVDFHLKLESNEYVNKHYNGLKPEAIEGLSIYSKTNVAEFLAESFTELRHNPKTTGLATYLGEILELNKRLLKFLLKKIRQSIQHHLR
ncbi:MAG: hypothetical protein VSS75_031205 [Candidatus Parabeggiatoa sp.]|nr:hypothetical protein [Candidatus Parabeggiatoa sp.]